MLPSSDLRALASTECSDALLETGMEMEPVRNPGLEALEMKQQINQIKLKWA